MKLPTPAGKPPPMPSVKPPRPEMSPEQMSQIFEAVKVLPLRDSDVILLKCNQSLPMETAKRIQQVMSEQFGGRQVVVLDGCFDLEILRVEKPQHRPEELKVARDRHLTSV